MAEAATEESSADAEAAALEADLQAKYDAAQALFDAQEYEKAYEAFTALTGYLDSNRRATASMRKWKAVRYKKALALYEEEKYEEAREIFIALDQYQSSRSYKGKCDYWLKRQKYYDGKALFDAKDYEAAKQIFESLGGFYDSRDMTQACDDCIFLRDRDIAEEKSYAEALALKDSGDLTAARDAFIVAGDYGDATEQLYIVLKEMKTRAVYDRAAVSQADGAFEDAYDLYTALGNYEDSAQKAALAKEAWLAELYQRANALQSDDPGNAYLLFLFLGEYQDSAALAQALRPKLDEQRIYAASEQMAADGSYALALCGFQSVAAYGDSQERGAEMKDCVQKLRDFKFACYLKEIGEPGQANALFDTLGDFQNAPAMKAKSTMRFTCEELRYDSTTEKSEVFIAPDGSRHRYQIFKGVHRWLDAVAFCEVLGGHMATLTTPEENEFVYRFMRSNGFLTAFFGFWDEFRTGDWVWVTGEPTEYLNWHRGQPSRSGKERYGMYFYKHLDGTWNDSHFYEDAKVDPGCSYICEWDE